MGIKRIPKYKDLPFEIGKTYVTKFQTGEKFTLTNIKYNSKGIRIGFDGIYENCPHLGVCPIGPDRLIPERIDDGFMEVCSECGTPLNDE